jgi:hypothetical protein
MLDIYLCDRNERAFKNPKLLSRYSLIMGGCYLWRISIEYIDGIHMLLSKNQICEFSPNESPNKKTFEGLEM